MDSTSKLTIQINSVGDFSAFAEGTTAIEVLEGALVKGRVALEGLAGSLGVGLSLGGLVLLGKSAIDLGKNIQDMSIGMGISTTAVQVLGYAAEQGDVSIDKIYGSVGKLTKALAEARNTASPAAQAFRQLGIDINQIGQLTPERQFAMVAQAIVGAADQTEAYKDATIILGRGVEDLMPVLRALGTEGYDALAQKAEAAGRVMSEDTVRRLHEAASAIDGFKNKIIITAGESIAAWSVLKDALSNSGQFEAFGKLWDAAVTDPIDRAAAALVRFQTKYADGIYKSQPAPIAQKPQPPAEDTASVQQLASLTAQLDAAKEATEQAKNSLESTAEAIAAVEKNPTLSPDQRAAALEKLYAQQKTELQAHLEDLGAERDLLMQIRTLEEAGFVLRGDNSPDQVAQRSTANLRPGQAPTEPQDQTLAATSKTSHAIASVGKDQSQDYSAIGNNANAAAGLTLLGSYNDKVNELTKSWGTMSQQAGAALGSLVGTLNNSIGTALDKLMLKTETFGQAARAIYKSLADSVIQSVADIAAKWFTEHVVMQGISAAFKTFDVAAHTSAEATKLSVTVAGQAGQTGATAAGSASRNAITLGETIFHGLQVAYRVLAHTLGEIAMTAVTLVQAGLRIASIIVESIAYVIKAAVGALSAMASIPYVGPILGVIAMAAVLAAGLGEVKAIGKGFDTGGYTGDGSPTDVAGVVHNQEFVFSAPAVRNIGRENLDALHRGGALRPASTGDSNTSSRRQSGSGGLAFFSYSDPVAQLQAAARHPAARKLLVDMQLGTIREYRK
jgi:hypothetical protein